MLFLCHLLGLPAATCGFCSNGLQCVQGTCVQYFPNSTPAPIGEIGCCDILDIACSGKPLCGPKQPFQP